MNLLDKDILLVDKPAGLSSFGVVARVRRVYTEQRRAEIVRDWEKSGHAATELPKSALPKRLKVGHAGTLDPFATGLLICLLGKATKRAGEFLKLDKRYEATIELGKVSSTGDIEGVISDSYESEAPSLSQIQSVLATFTGEIEQTVPAYSAVKIDGRRAYDLARKGVEVEMPTRKVKIYELTLVDYHWPYLKIACHVSSGTYIRALGEDIGKALGVGGYLTELRRTAIGDFSVDDAVTLDSVLES